MKNELIQKLSKKAFMLAHEANDIHEQEEGEELSQTQFSNVFNQKLIELTVLECSAVGFNIFDMEIDAPASDLQYYVRDGIIKHFGVDE